MSERFIVPDWPAPPGVRALCTTRVGGTSAAPFDSMNLGPAVGDDPAALAENRHRLRNDASLPEEPRWLRQVHGTEVADLDAATQPDSADASVTHRAGVVCALLTADCLPVLLTSRDGRAVAAAHAGWRGLAGGVIENACRALGRPASELLAWLGPAIGPDHFEVGTEVRAAFMDSNGEAAAAFVANGRGRWQCDLYELARQRLRALGVTRIHGGGRCTFGEPARFFSYRRDQGRTGRMATLIWRETL